MSKIHLSVNLQSPWHTSHFPALHYGYSYKCFHLVYTTILNSTHNSVPVVLSRHKFKVFFQQQLAGHCQYAHNCVCAMQKKPINKQNSTPHKLNNNKCIVFLLTTVALPQNRKNLPCSDWLKSDNW